MKHFFIAIVLCLVLLPTHVIAIELYSENAVLYNLDTDEVVLNKNKDEIVSIASMTKIMTAIVAIENIDNLDDKVVIPKEAFDGLVEENAYQAGFQVGEEVTYRDLLYALLLPSGADAAQALAILVSGDINHFVLLMNEQATNIGLENSSFSNPIGLDDPNNFSTVDDVAKLLKYALKNKIFYTIFTAKEYITSNNRLNLKSATDSYNKRYNMDISFIMGSKTGYTEEAGFCLASIASRDNANLLLVTARAPYTNKYPYHITDAVNIYQYYFDNYEYQPILNKGDILATIKVKGLSNKRNIEIKQTSDIYKYLPKDSDIKYEYKGVNEINNKYKVGDVLGVYYVYLEDKLLYKTDVILEEKISYYTVYILLGIITFVIMIGLSIKKIKIR